MVVSYTLSGSAENGVDYESRTNQVTIPAGETECLMSIVPANDALAEGDETVIVTLVPDPAYEIVLSSSTDQVVIHDNEFQLTVVGGTGDGVYIEGAVVAISNTVPAGQFDAWTGDTATVDDVNSAATTVTVPAANITVTAMVALESEGFEAGLGNWVNASGDTHDWTRGAGGTPSGSTGPDHDQTTGGSSGYYMFLEGNEAISSGDNALLEGPNLDAGDYNIMLTFYHHMYGQDMGTLYVDVYDGLWNNAEWSITDEQHGSSGADYTQAQVDLSGYSGTIKVRFRAVAAGGELGDMAIDDIEITAVPIPTTTTGDVANIFNNGGGDNSWTNTANWSLGAEPVATNAVYVETTGADMLQINTGNAVASEMVLGSESDAGDAAIGSGGKLTLSGKLLLSAPGNVATFENAGTLDAGSIELYMGTLQVTNSGTMAASGDILMGRRDTSTFDNTGDITCDHLLLGNRSTDVTFNMLAGTVEGTLLGAWLSSHAGSGAQINLHGGTMTFDDVSVFDTNRVCYGNYSMDVANNGQLIVKGLDLESEFENAITDGHLTGVTVDQVAFIAGNTIISANDAPVFTVDPINEANATEDIAYAGSVANATDAEGDTLTYSKVSGPAWLSVASNGALSGTPGAGDVGANAWTVQVDDGNGGTDGGTDTATLNITVDANPHVFTNGGGDNSWTNTANWSLATVPAATDDVYVLTAGADMLQINTGNAVASEMNLGSDSFSGDAAIGSGGVLTLSGQLYINSKNRVSDFENEGTLNVGSLQLYRGTLQFTNSGTIASSGDIMMGRRDTATFDNTGDITCDDLLLGNQSVNVTFNMLGGTVEGTKLAPWNVVGTSGGLLNLHAGTMTFDDVSLFDANSVCYGNYSMDVQYPGRLVVEGLDLESEFENAITDGYLTGGSGLVVSYVGGDTIIYVNTAPVFTVDPINVANATEGVAYSQSIAGSATDADSDTLSYSKLTGPAWLAVAADGSLSGTPVQSDVGANVFTVEVDDGKGGTDTATLNITTTASLGLNTFTNGGGDNSWTNTANWSRAAVPVATDDVYVLTAGADMLQINATNAVASEMNLGGISIAGKAAIGSGGTLTLSGKLSINSKSRASDFENEGTLNVGNIELYRGVPLQFTNSGTIASSGDIKVGTSDISVFDNTGNITVDELLLGKSTMNVTFNMLGGTVQGSLLGSWGGGANDGGQINLHAGTMTFDDVSLFDTTETFYGNYSMDVQYPGTLVVEGQDLKSEFENAITDGYLTGGSGLNVSYVGGNTFVSILEQPQVIESGAMNGSGQFEVVASGLSSGTTYYLWRETDLTAVPSFTNMVDNVSAASETETLTDPNPPATNAFYKVTD